MKWKTERRKIAELNPAPYNPRKLTEKQKHDLSVSLDRFDLAAPIIINRNNRVIGGHQRIDILKTKGVTEVDVRVPTRKLTEAEEKELNLRLNKNIGEFDPEKLIDFDAESLKDVGFSDEEIENLFGGDSNDGPITVDIKAFDMVHVLISIPKDKFIDIQDELQKIKQNEFVEYEQSAN